MTFANRTAVITGAAGRIGRETAKAFSRYGVKLYLVDIDLERLEEVAAELRNAGAEVHTIQMDVSDPDSIKKSSSLILGSAGRVDILVNNAGAWPKGGIFECEYHEWKRTLDLNLSSVFLLSQIFACGMKAQGYGRIINLGSIAGEVGLPGYCAYSAAKAGVIMFTKTIAMELASSGVTVNSVSPGLITDNRSINSGTWIGRTGTGDEVANAIIFLAADEAGYITGVDLPVDGGRILGPLCVKKQ